jgi:hypothetical protein
MVQTIFLLHLNDFPEVVTSLVRLLADECLLYRPIKSAKDHKILQEDLNNLDACPNHWELHINAKICYIFKPQK